MEDGYNLKEATSQFAHEPHIALFAEVLSGKLEETVFHRWLQTQTSLTEAFSQQQKGEVGTHTHTLFLALPQVDSTLCS